MKFKVGDMVKVIKADKLVFDKELGWEGVVTRITLDDYPYIVKIIDGGIGPQSAEFSYSDRHLKGMNSDIIRKRLGIK